MLEIKFERKSSSVPKYLDRREISPQTMLDELYSMPVDEVQKKIDYYFMPYQRHGELYKFLTFGKEDEAPPGGSWKRIQSFLCNKSDTKIRGHIVEHFKRQKRIARKIKRDNKKRKNSRKKMAEVSNILSIDVSLAVSPEKLRGKRKNKSKLKSPVRSPKKVTDDSSPEEKSLSVRSDSIGVTPDENKDDKQDQKSGSEKQHTFINLFNDDANPTSLDMNSPEGKKSFTLNKDALLTIDKYKSSLGSPERSKLSKTHGRKGPKQKLSGLSQMSLKRSVRSVFGQLCTSTYRNNPNIDSVSSEGSQESDMIESDNRSQMSKRSKRNAKSHMRQKKVKLQQKMLNIGRSFRGPSDGKHNLLIWKQRSSSSFKVTSPILKKEKFIEKVDKETPNRIMLNIKKKSQNVTDLCKKQSLMCLGGPAFVDDNLLDPVNQQSGELLIKEELEVNETSECHCTSSQEIRSPEIIIQADSSASVSIEKSAAKKVETPQYSAFKQQEIANVINPIEEMTDESEISPIVNRRPKNNEPLVVHICRIVEPTPTIKKTKQVSKKKLKIIKATDETSDESTSKFSDCNVPEPKKVVTNTKQNQLYASMVLGEKPKPRKDFGLGCFINQFEETSKKATNIRASINHGQSLISRGYKLSEASQMECGIYSAPPNINLNDLKTDCRRGIQTQHGPRSSMQINILSANGLLNVVDEGLQQQNLHSISTHKKQSRSRAMDTLNQIHQIYKHPVKMTQDVKQMHISTQPEFLVQMPKQLLHTTRNSTITGRNSFREKQGLFTPNTCRNRKKIVFKKQSDFKVRSSQQTESFKIEKHYNQASTYHDSVTSVPNIITADVIINEGPSFLPGIVDNKKIKVKKKLITSARNLQDQILSRRHLSNVNSDDARGHLPLQASIQSAINLSCLSPKAIVHGGPLRCEMRNQIRKMKQLQAIKDQIALQQQQIHYVESTNSSSKFEQEEPLMRMAPSIPQTARCMTQGGNFLPQLKRVHIKNRQSFIQKDEDKEFFQLEELQEKFE